MKKVLYFKANQNEHHELHVKTPKDFFGVTNVRILKSKCGKVWYPENSKTPIEIGYEEMQAIRAG